MTAHQCPACACGQKTTLRAPRWRSSRGTAPNRKSRPAAQRLAATEEWRPGRRRATWLPEEEQATQSDELYGKTVSRYGHLRSAPVVALVYARSGTTPRRASLLDSTRFGASSMAYRLSAKKVTDSLLSSSLDSARSGSDCSRTRERCSAVERFLLATRLVQAQENCPEDRESLVAFGLSGSLRYSVLSGSTMRAGLHTTAGVTT